jgi:hypothetical protein
MNDRTDLTNAASELLVKAPKVRQPQTWMKRLFWSALCTALIVVAAGAIQQSVYFAAASRQAAQFEKDARLQRTRQCALVDAAPDCAVAINRGSRSNRRAEFDLYSQKSMALWTAIMGAMAVVGITLSAAGVYLVYGTWRQTAEAAEYSRRTLRSYIARERALLGIGAARSTTDNKSANPNGFVVRCQNIGHSAAHVNEVQWEYLPGPVWPERLRYSLYDGPIVAPGANGPLPRLYIDGEFSDPLWLVGQVHYTSLESEECMTPFCFKLRHVDGGGYGPAEWIAETAICSGMPASR